MKFDQSHFEILRKISKTPEQTQRELAGTLGFSLGKLNYCLKSLKQKGLVKINNFKKSKKNLNMFINLHLQVFQKKQSSQLNSCNEK